MQGVAITAALLLGGANLLLLVIVGWMLVAWWRAPIEARALSMVLTACGWVSPRASLAILSVAWERFVQPSLDAQAKAQAEQAAQVSQYVGKPN